MIAALNSTRLTGSGGADVLRKDMDTYSVSYAASQSYAMIRRVAPPVKGALPLVVTLRPAHNLRRVIRQAIFMLKRGRMSSQVSASGRLRWGILSVANIGLRAVMPAIQQSRNGEMVAVCSREHDKAARAA